MEQYFHRNNLIMCRIANDIHLLRRFTKVQRVFNWSSSLIDAADRIGKIADSLANVGDFITETRVLTSVKP